MSILRPVSLVKFAEAAWLSRGVDIAVVLIAPWLGLWMRLGEITHEVLVLKAIISYFAASSILGLLFWGLSGLPRKVAPYDSWQDLGLILLLAMAVPLMAAVAAYGYGRLLGVPRSLPIFHGALLLAGLCVTRFGLRLIAHHGLIRHESGFDRTDYLLIGEPDLAIIFSDCMASAYHHAQKIAGLLTDEARYHEGLVGDVPVIGPIASLADVLSHLKIHGVQVSKLILVTDRTKLPDHVFVTADKEGLEVVDFYASIADEL